MRRKRVPIFAEVVIECAAVAIARWLKEQIALREDVSRGSFARGGGVAGQVIYHAPDAIR